MAVTPNSIVTPQAVKSAAAVCTSANTDYTDAAANAVKLVTAGPNGARLTRLQAIPRATVTASQLQLFRSTDGGATRRLFRTHLLPAQTMSATTEMALTDFGYSDANPLLLSADEEIYVATGVATAAGICFTAEWGDY